MGSDVVTDAQSTGPTGQRRGDTVRIKVCYAMSGPALHRQEHYVASYALAMRCPVLTETKLLRMCYRKSGTDLGYAATRARLEEEEKQGIGPADPHEIVE
eukprot:1995812-Rhodomonas_salina.1